MNLAGRVTPSQPHHPGQSNILVKRGGCHEYQYKINWDMPRAALSFTSQYPGVDDLLRDSG